MEIPDTRTGIYEEDGIKVYYVNGVKQKNLGLIKVDGAYYYVRSNGQVVVNSIYWTTKTNDLLPEANYTFGADGKMLQGIVEKEGVLYYYENGISDYVAELAKGNEDMDIPVRFAASKVIEGDELILKQLKFWH